MQGYLKISICVFLLTFVVSIRGDSNSTQACAVIQEKVKELSKAAHRLCEIPHSNEDLEFCSCPRTWKSIGLINLGNSNFRTTAVPATFSYEIPDTVPDDAKEILVYARIWSGNNSPRRTTDFIIYTEEGDDKYRQYLYSETYSTHARYNTNSDNLWFPMPSNRRVFLVVPHTINEAGGSLYVIGYR
jgi:hypothetical protein